MGIWFAVFEAQLDEMEPSNRLVTEPLSADKMLAHGITRRNTTGTLQSAQKDHEVRANQFQSTASPSSEIDDYQGLRA